MGYYTSYSLYVLNAKRDNISPEEMAKASASLFKKIYPDTNIDYTNYTGFLFLNPLFSAPFEWLLDDPLKWYDHCDDMIELAQEYPEMIFMLEGHGEDINDHWREYYQGDRYKRVVMHWDPAPEWANIAPY